MTNAYYVNLCIFYTIASKDETNIPGWMSTPKTCVVKNKGLDYHDRKMKLFMRLIKVNQVENYLTNTALQSQGQDFASLVPQCMSYPMYLQSMITLWTQHIIIKRQKESYNTN